MRRLILVVSLTAGCASSARLERQAREHSLNAQAAGDVGDYDRAAAEKREAAKLHAKAVKRAYEEGNTTSVVVPTPL